jgi:ferredoxin
MRITIDRARCIGSGICESIAPEFFEVGDDGALVLRQENFDEADQADVDDAVRSCPTMALSVSDD